CCEGSRRGPRYIRGRRNEHAKTVGLLAEPAEIEAALNDCPGVSASAVVVRTGEPHDARIVAYVASPSARPIAIDALQQHLRRALPSYMLPSKVIALQALPVTDNGKIDYAALPSPEAPVPEAYVAPRTPAERLLAEIWRTMLRVDRVGVHDNFFALGGDSILGILTVARARQQGLAITPDLLFKHQS